MKVQATRRCHPAVELAINSLEYRGLERVNIQAEGSLTRTLGLSVLTHNVYRLSLMVCNNLREWRKLKPEA